MDRSRILATIALGFLGLIIPAAIASRFGAAAYHSGGPAGYAIGGGNCTVCHRPFNPGPGSVELLGAPVRYQPDTAYDLTVRISDTEQDAMGFLRTGAGFQISAEGGGGHLGTLLLADVALTKFANAVDGYLTHQEAGLLDSAAGWGTDCGTQCGYYDYRVRWRSPIDNAGPVTFFVAANATDRDQPFFSGVRYYATHRIAHYAEPGDYDGDSDLDLADVAALQVCYSGDSATASAACVHLDFDRDGMVALTDVTDFVDALLLSGPTATAPGPFMLADAVRGGQLYDRWWMVSGAPAPTGTHPLYPTGGPQAGSTTFRCKECHGWDYKGAEGAYAIGSSHYTGIAGIANTQLDARAIFELLSADPTEVVSGHDMDAYGMTDADLWDVVSMILEEVVDTDQYIAPDESFIGLGDAGMIVYDETCMSCHGATGAAINFGTPVNPEYVGGLARRNPWEFLHKARFGHPGSPMPALELLNRGVQDAANIGRHAASFPD